MRAKRSIVIGGLAASLLGGGAALAARSGDDGDKAEDAILSDAAKRLGVNADELEDALAQGRGRPARPGREGRRPDQGAGRRDQEAPQALRPGARRSRRPGAARLRATTGSTAGRPGFGGPGGVLDAVADELGISVAQALLGAA